MLLLFVGLGAPPFRRNGSVRRDYERGGRPGSPPPCSRFSPICGGTSALTAVRSFELPESVQEDRVLRVALRIDLAEGIGTLGAVEICEPSCADYFERLPVHTGSLLSGHGLSVTSVESNGSTG